MVHGEEEAGRLAHVLSDELRDAAGSISLAKAVASEGCNYARELATARPYVSVPTRPSGEAVIPTKAGIQCHAAETLRHLSQSESYSLSSTCSKDLKNTQMGTVSEFDPKKLFPS